jgi:hypothetical protein
LFPCVALAATLYFYRTLGFEVTYEQQTPYEYGAVRRGGIDLHFHGRKQVNPEKSFSTCLVFVSGVEPYHRAFADALRAKYGKVPTAGLPRITRLRRGQTRFAAFPSEAAEPIRGEAAYVAEAAALPLDLGWFETVGLRADGEIVRWSTEGEDAGARPVEDRYQWLSSLVDGCRRYPELRVLLPARPAGAVDCRHLGNSLFAEGKMFCPECCGLGWVPAAGT